MKEFINYYIWLSYCICLVVLLADLLLFVYIYISLIFPEFSIYLYMYKCKYFSKLPYMCKFYRGAYYEWMNQLGKVGHRFAWHERVLCFYLFIVISNVKCTVTMYVYSILFFCFDFTTANWLVTITNRKAHKVLLNILFWTAYTYIWYPSKWMSTLCYTHNIHQKFY